MFDVLKKSESVSKVAQAMGIVVCGISFLRGPQVFAADLQAASKPYSLFDAPTDEKKSAELSDKNSPKHFMLLPDDAGNVYAPPRVLLKEEGMNQGGVNLDLKFTYLSNYIYRGVDHSNFPGRSQRPNLQFDGTVTFDLDKWPHPFVGIFANLYNNGDKTGAYKNIRRAFLIEAVLFAAGFAFLFFFGIDALNILFKKNIPYDELNMMLLIYGGVFLMQFAMLLHKPIELQKKTRLMAAGIGIALLFNITANIIFIKKYTTLLVPAVTTLLSAAIYVLFIGGCLLYNKNAKKL